jgi:hypothetical protein
MGYNTCPHIPISAYSEAPMKRKIVNQQTLRDLKVYENAMDFLLGQKGVTPDLVNKYLPSNLRMKSLER